MSGKLTEEIDQTIDTLTWDLAKAMVVRALAHRVGAVYRIGDTRELQAEARYHLENLRRRNDIFAELPDLHVFVENATMILKWPRELT